LAGGEVRFFTELVGRSAALRQLCERIRQAAPTPSPILIEGESGTGKELVARAIHETSDRHGGPFVAVHCGAIAENLLESELFGHEKGAFTGADSTRVGFFEEAHGGTLFLDEISLMSRSCQAKLLRVLENGLIRRVGASREFQVDVRIVAAANEPLEKQAASGAFRQDLFYRLNVVTLAVPALRERREDIPLLCYHFADRFAQEAGKPFEAFSENALAAFCAYAYPGNIRELRNLVDRAVVFARGPVIGTADLPEPLRRLVPEPLESGIHANPDALVMVTELSQGGAPSDGLSLDERLDALEKHFIETALAQACENRTRAAALLKIKRTTLLEKMARLGLIQKTSAPAKPKKPKRKGRRGPSQ
jgi:DNA-binding NtrC family response regulator